MLAKTFGVTADELLSQEEPGAEQERGPEPQEHPYPPRTPPYTTSPKTRKWLNRGLKMVILVRCTVVGLILILAGGYILHINLEIVDSLSNMGSYWNQKIRETSGLTSPTGIACIFMIVVGVISIVAGIVATVILSRREKARKKENPTEN